MSTQVMVFGEITTTAKVDYEAIVRKTCRDIGFTSEDVGLDADKCKVLHTFNYILHPLVYICSTLSRESVGIPMILIISKRCIYVWCRSRS